MKENEDKDPELAPLEKLLMANSDTMSEVIPAEPSSDLNCELHDYQKVGLGWMMERELTAKDRDGLDNSKRLKPEEQVPEGWEVRYDPSSTKPYYVNLATGIKYNQHPSSRDAPLKKGELQEKVRASGGILADEMGLGKTVQMISLIVTCPPPKDTTGPKSTLVVCPLSLLSQWESELNRKVKEGVLKVGVFHGPSRAQSFSELQKFDVVLTTYATLSLELSEDDRQKKSSKKRGRADKILLGHDWYRVILDEAHTIKDKSTKTAKACFQVRAARRWCVTGTPISNKLEDMFSLLHFINMEPYGQFNWWQQHIMRPVKNKDSRGYERLNIILQKVLLRRTKMQTNKDGARLINLPPRSVLVEKIKFSPKEREMYENYYMAARNKVSSMLQSEAVLEGYAHILLLLLRLRQCCAHPLLMNTKSSSKKSSKKQHHPDPHHHHHHHQHQESSEDTSSEEPVYECMQCFETASIRTECKHLFCQGCLEPALKLDRECPVCQAPLTALQCTPAAPPPVKEEEEPAFDDVFFPSAKTDALISSLVRVRKQDPTVKSVVFSQWTSMLSLVEIALQRSNIRFVRLDGSMTQSARQKAISQFSSDPEITVFLISIKAGGLGLNLTAASRCYILDPWWCQGTENQAIDRIHRIGQTREVVVTRFVVEDTIEESILDLQETKNEIARNALGRNSEVKKTMRLEELKTLFGLKY